MESTEGMLELYYLPGYSPELNPDETVWSYVKHHAMDKMAIKGPEQFKKIALGVLGKLQNLSRIVRNFYLAKSLRYAISTTYASFSKPDAGRLL